MPDLLEENEALDRAEPLPTFQVVPKKEFMTYKAPPQTEEEKKEALRILHGLHEIGPFEMVSKEPDTDHSDASQDATNLGSKRPSRVRKPRPRND